MTRDGIITVLLVGLLFAFGLGIGYKMGADNATAEIRFELLPCAD